ncbi:hypothetical protein K493DRAFT_318157 [Basidiobolus meristosporus CBS 931.73]|uniref:Globin-like protein n=1 Tax=Basidiobolus meristosporus CBS 931.73 TaxID=1314790 RepID=A0A1Y1XWN7_9FUNG|nr:hypothetical protein K493DRAFT_318157 [Basidiobolus meristosporus CBS 931.73]|eukprot:ORX90160.1 hypothetical protein K493DRAFT_318157 [Basidiobolus meristosporus CBS 931.73]
MSQDNATGCPFKASGELYLIEPKEGTVLAELGVEKVEKIVKQFYRYNVTVEDTRIFFRGINIERLERMQTVFLVHLLGGREINTRKMRAVHKRLLELNDANFDAVLVNLRQACVDLEVPPNLLEKIMAAAETTRDDVLGRSHFRSLKNRTCM